MRRFVSRYSLPIWLISVGVFLFILFRYTDPFMSFDAQVWQANPGGMNGHDTARSRMIDDLVTHHLHKGMTRQEVYRLLGKPDAQSEWDKQHGVDVYGYGYVGYMGIDPSDLQLEYDAADKLINIKYGET